MERKVRTGRLKKGMYVSNLDRPWLDTPFLIQGFYISDDEELKALDKYCEYVFIDTDRGPGADIYLDESFVLPTNEFLEKFLKNHTREVDYEDQCDVSAELPVAHAALEETLENHRALIDRIKQGAKLDLKKVRVLLAPVTESILRNPDALLWLSQLRDKADDPQSHAVDHCILALAFARYMGLPQDDMFHLAVGILFYDIGQTNVDPTILSKRTTLSEDEYRVMQRHVDDGVDYLKLFDDIHEDSINTVLTHHERFDGSGYPNKLSGAQIPVYGRMAGIVDCYHAMVTPRVYSDAISGHTALQKLYNWRDKTFQAEMVQQFMRCLGIYPTGSLLEMKSGEVGIVLCQHRIKHTRPRVMVLLDKNKQALRDFSVVELAEQAGDDALEILQGLDPGAYGITPSDYYL